MLKLTHPIVSVAWLNDNLSDKNIIVIDATLKKVVDDKKNGDQKLPIKTARFLDIKNVFSKIDAPFPNSMLDAKEFEKRARELGVNNDSAIIVYDQYGHYSAPRVWWMFKAMGFHNIAVLDGGLPLWLELGYPVQNSYSNDFIKGNFTANYTTGLIHSYDKVLHAMEDSETVILDARSHDRFLGTVPEPRKGLRSGHIPNSKSLPYTSLLNGVQMKSGEELKEMFSKYSENNFIFSCGSGITACILALGAEVAGIESKSVYDGSWTEWGSLKELPIEIG